MIDIWVGLMDDPSNKVDKHFGTYTIHHNCILKNETDFINPVITMEATGTDKAPFRGSNYMYLPCFDRYYYITDIKHIRNSIWQITGHVDVLMSFKSDILNLEAIISKQADPEYGSRNFNDGSYMTLEENFTEVSEFPTGLNDSGEFILMTAGRIQTSSGGGGSSEF